MKIPGAIAQSLVTPAAYATDEIHEAYRWLRENEPLGVAEVAGIRALLVHAISPEAKRFYERYGFQECPGKPMTLVLMLRDAQGPYEQNSDPSW